MDDLWCYPLSGAFQDALIAIMQRLELTDRFKCALVCRPWADAATAATRSVVKTESFDVSSLQQWLKRHGNQIEVLHLNLHSETALTALPCPELRDLQMSDLACADGHLAIGSGAWSDIAAATKLTSVSLSWVDTPFQPEAVSALTALPHLQQLSWCSLRSGVKKDLQTDLSDSALLQHQTQLTSLKLQGVTAEALQHLGSLSKLQHLSIKRASVMAEINPTVPQEWAEGSLPDLQRLTALTSLEWDCSEDLPGSIYQLTALQQLTVCAASTTALEGLQVMPGLSRLCVRNIKGLYEASKPWQLPALQHLELTSRGRDGVFDMAMLARCTQLRQICLQCMDVRGPVSLLGSSSILQWLSMFNCRAHAASWQQFFQGSAQLPELTMLRLEGTSPMPHRGLVQPADLESVVACCTGLKELRLANAAGANVLTRLAHLTGLDLYAIHHQQCSSLAQLTGLRQLHIFNIEHLNVAGLRKLTALQQLTSLSLGGLSASQLSEAVKSRLTGTLPGCKPSSYEHALVNKVRTCGVTVGQTGSLSRDGMGAKSVLTLPRTRS